MDNELAFQNFIYQLLKKITVLQCQMTAAKEQGSNLRENIVISETSEQCEKLLEILSHPSPSQIMNDLIDFLNQRSKDTHYTYLNTTSLPKSDITELCCFIAEGLAHHSGDKKSALEYLMPNLVYFFNFLNYEDIRLQPLKIVLQNHIISDNGTSVIPIELLIGTSLVENIKSLHHHPFVADTLLTESEKKRLFQHSRLTTELLDLKNQHDELTSKSYSLYGELFRLITNLKKAGQHGFHGGSVDEVGVDAWTGLESFRKYWTMLGVEKQKMALQLSESFRNDLLPKILKTGGYCIESLASNLSDVLEKHKEEFHQISLSSKDRSIILQNLLFSFNEKKKTLLDQLQKGTYEGADFLFLSKNQVARYVSVSDISNYTDLLLILKNLFPEEITEVCKIITPHKLIQTIESVENLLILILELDELQIKNLIDIVGNSLQHLFRCEELGRFLDCLSNNAMQAFLQGAQSALPSLIKNKWTFFDIYDALSGGKKSIFFSFSNHLTKNLVRTFWDFKYFYKRLHKNEKSTFFQNMMNDLQRMLTETHSIECFIDCYHLLSDEEQNVLFDRIKPIFLKIIKNKWDFILLYTALSGNQRDYFLNEFKWIHPEIVKEGLNFSLIHKILYLPEGQEFSKKLSRKLYDFIKNAHTLDDYVLTNEQFFTEIETALLNLIDDAIDFMRFYHLLSSEYEKNNYFQKMKYKLPSIIKNKDDFSYIYAALTHDQREQLKLMITTSSNTFFKSAPCFNSESLKRPPGLFNAQNHSPNHLRHYMRSDLKTRGKPMILRPHRV